MKSYLIAGIAALVTLASPFARAGVVFDEAVNGDLSNSGLTPTWVTVWPGLNEIHGTTGRGATGLDRDYFTVNIPWGFALNSVWELPGTGVGGNVSFLGLEAGSQVTLGTNPASAAGLLGWTHYGPTAWAINLFPLLETPNDGSSGFSGALPAGNYSFWVQDFNAGAFNYGFALEVVAVPEASTFGYAAGALALLVVARRRFGKSAKTA